MGGFRHIESEVFDLDVFDNLLVEKGVGKEASLDNFSLVELHLDEKYTSIIKKILER
ncbi:hypothetical protein [Sutcliffiella rhizosphaerae]|uniref:hypothetical protein n=1 Tax=Sutcliffiella rhizosphaerae TaxID=2880967 RepID=UPI001E46CA70|nr:hypothetical protein [Sutcliffiella rhizosphaerae]